MSNQSDLPPVLADRADQLLNTTTYAGYAGMIANSFEAAGLDHDTLMLIWLAALVAIDAPSESFLMNLGAASQSDVKLDQVHGVLEALAPVVGGPRVVSARVKITTLLEARPSPEESGPRDPIRRGASLPSVDQAAASDRLATLSRRRSAWEPWGPAARVLDLDAVRQRQSSSSPTRW